MMPPHSTISQSPLFHHQGHVSLSSTPSHSLSLPSGFRSFTFLRTVRKALNKNPSVSCSISPVGRSKPGWWSLYRRISLMEDPEMGVGSVLDQHVKEGKRVNKWELRWIGEELRKFRQYKLALEVYEWMSDSAQKFKMSTGDAAIHLALIAKVRGILDAEDYFLKLSDTLKDKRTYGALLSAYVQAKSREKAESLVEKMKAGGYAKQSHPFNLMMILYRNLKEYDQVDLVASEMGENNISLNTYSYSIWLSSCGAQGSVEKTEQVFEQMKMESSIKPNWSMFSIMASMYIKNGQLEKAENFIKKVERSIEGQGKIPYHYVISLYCSVGKKEEVYRVWNVYKSKFSRIPNLGYYTMISSLVRLGDIEGAELFYEEWLSVKSTYEPRIVNVLMSSYVRDGLLVKADGLFGQIFKSGGKPNSSTWESLAYRHIRESRVSDALSCLKQALLVDASKKWTPRPVNVSSILKICKQNDDTESKGILMELLRQAGCLENEVYMSLVPLTCDEELPMVNGRSDDEVDEMVMDLKCISTI